MTESVRSHASAHRMEQASKSHETTVKAPETAQINAACIDDVAKSLSQNGYGQSPVSQGRPFAQHFSELCLVSRQLSGADASCCQPTLALISNT